MNKQYLPTCSQEFKDELLAHMRHGYNSGAVPEVVAYINQLGSVMWALVKIHKVCPDKSTDAMTRIFTGFKLTLAKEFWPLYMLYDVGYINGMLLAAYLDCRWSLYLPEENSNDADQVG